VRRFSFLMLFVTCCLPACAGYIAGHDSGLANADKLFDERKYSEAVIVYDKIAKESPGTERGARALYGAAVTRVFYGSSYKDYTQALQEFDEFLRVYPKSEKAREAQNWRRVLKTVLELKKENERLTRSIDQLKKIDIRHEEQRKTK